MKPLELLEQGRFLGEEFLLWLWMRSQTEGGASGEEGDGSACFLDDQIQLASERGEVKQISLAKGSPAESREAFEALSRGMRPVKMKIRILSGDLEWVGMLDASQLRLSTLKMPPSSAKAPQDRIQDRLFLLEEGYGHLDRRFKRFLEERTFDQGEALAQVLMAWVKAGLSGVPESPWDGAGSTDERVAAAQVVGRDPGVWAALGRLMDHLAEHDTTMTLTTPHDGRSVTLTPEAAARAGRSMKGGG